MRTTPDLLGGLLGGLFTGGLRQRVYIDRERVLESPFFSPTNRHNSLASDTKSPNLLTPIYQLFIIF